ncbi:hypothetical protein GPECTOR_24g229 [Gonium pectorale]|uniref:Uncharacterized protein n=1 Tax=Gonium pectorale TaxID=33097 RepID=A0A150GGH0_GONPE|nr:hypothetical protein GPECTOR_24g229 [Gonium pectorale]|eukprot:KXZ48939.1 hypothetical protein GPECTOR_24g229 [Gonium pectorale]
MEVAIPPAEGHFVQDHKQHRHDTILNNLSNKYRYAGRHGYTFLPIMWTYTDTDLPHAWVKIPALLEHLPHYDWIWCTDSDLFITNAQVTIEQQVLLHVPADKHIVVSRDCSGMNTGSFFIRNSPDAVWFLRDVYARRRESSVPDYAWWFEQAMFNHLIKNDARSAALFYYVPQTLINSYTPKPNAPAQEQLQPTCGGRWWQVGDFAVHFPGRADKTEAWDAVLVRGGKALAALLP